MIDKEDNNDSECNTDYDNNYLEEKSDLENEGDCDEKIDKEEESDCDEKN